LALSNGRIWVLVNPLANPAELRFDLSNGRIWVLVNPLPNPAELRFDLSNGRIWVLVNPLPNPAYEECIRRWPVSLSLETKAALQVLQTYLQRWLVSSGFEMEVA
jgi:hypothetical protein